MTLTRTSGPARLITGVDMDIRDYFIGSNVEFIESVAESLDRHLEQLDELCKQSPDPDGFGIYDDIEEVCGICFVVSQKFIVSCCSVFDIKKSKALKFGPRLPCGLTIPEVVNHAANYWKHHDEWSPAQLGRREVATIRAIEQFGVNVKRDYVLSSILAVLTPVPHRLKGLIPHLEAWSEELKQNG